MINSAGAQQGTVLIETLRFFSVYSRMLHIVGDGNSIGTVVIFQSENCGFNSNLNCHMSICPWARYSPSCLPICVLVYDCAKKLPMMKNITNNNGFTRFIHVFPTQRPPTQ
ncbi:hypothetical protein ILYODFUR_038370 [Ilyodon furcidens]|uniref:Uncharacterized protein n=1 Tax=Ilyodon furcidens TaxID=33524 RepID=A0ABV0TI82_9TELE